MQIDKSQVLDMIKSKGGDEKAAQADKELPDKVDPDQHADLLGKFGVDPKELLGKAGGLGDKLGL